MEMITVACTDAQGADLFMNDFCVEAAGHHLWDISTLMAETNLKSGFNNKLENETGFKWKILRKL